jgi:hypothetical protein
VALLEAAIKKNTQLLRAAEADLKREVKTAAAGVTCPPPD